MYENSQLYRDMFSENYQLEKDTVFHISWDGCSYYFRVHENIGVKDYTISTLFHVIRKNRNDFDFWESVAEILTMEEFEDIKLKIKALNHY